MVLSTPLMQHAADAVLAVASANGMEVQGLGLIGGYANIMFKLEPFPIVARVAGSSSAVRIGDGWLAREVRVADYLTRVGTSAARPWHGFSPGPYHHQGHYFTFWEHLEIRREAVSPTQLGSALRQLHSSLEHYTEALPVFGALDEAWAILARPEVGERLTTDDLEVIARKSDHVRTSLSGFKMRYRPLHGDSHHGNLWPTNDGLIWGDFEDVHLGPVEWDLACMTASSTVFGRGTAAAESLGAYAESYDPSLLKLLVEARTLQAIAWAAITLPNPNSNERFRKRMEWLVR